ncbi:hypothetical protein LOZ49_006883, partial [Ophidiomyces ophidiicola]
GRAGPQPADAAARVRRQPPRAPARPPQAVRAHRPLDAPRLPAAAHRPRRSARPRLRHPPGHRHHACLAEDHLAQHLRGAHAVGEPPRPGPRPLPRPSCRAAPPARPRCRLLPVSLAGLPRPARQPVLSPHGRAPVRRHLLGRRRRPRRPRPRARRRLLLRLHARDP